MIRCASHLTGSLRHAALILLLLPHCDLSPDEQREATRSALYPCGERCPETSECLDVKPKGDVPQLECVPNHQRYCAPCHEPRDCLTPGSSFPQNTCVSHPNGLGSFCATTCDEDSPCPEGAQCDEQESGHSLCVPQTGLCGCSEWATETGAQTPCAVLNPFGSCSGVRFCDTDGLTECDAPSPKEESCNGVDDNCDGQVDTTFPEQSTGCDGEDDDLCLDGTFTCVEGTLVCNDPGPPRPELCNGIDDDCDGQTDAPLSPPGADLFAGVCEGAQKVCAGVLGWQEPDYTALDGFEAPERSCDERDNDCDGQVDVLFRNGAPHYYRDANTTVDRLKGSPCGTGPCAGGEVVCTTNQQDLTCSTLVNAAPESCNGEDDDCNNLEDDVPDGPPGSLQLGVCAEAPKTCVEGAWLDPDYALLKTPEVCDGKDNDCNGETDDDLPPLSADLQQGVCEGALKACSDGQWIEPDPTNLPFYEVEEVTCDGKDNDCDGETDVPLSPPTADLYEGVCEHATKVCAGVLGWQEPDYTSLNGFEDPELSCDGKDNNCDGETDEGFDFSTDVNHCGACLNACHFPNGSAGCVDGGCVLTSCNPGYTDCDPATPGCETHNRYNCDEPIIATLSPFENVYNDTALICEAGPLSPESILTYEWRNLTSDQAVGAGPTLLLSPSMASPLETIECRITAEDPNGATANANVQVVLKNRAPVVSEVALNPTTGIYTGTLLTCNSTANDPDGSPVEVNHTWQNTTTNTALESGDTLLLTSYPTDPGDVIACSAEATDPHGGAHTGTASVTVENSPPVLTTPVISPPFGVTPQSILICFAAATDIDVELPSLTYRWRNDTTDTHLGEGNYVTLTSTTASPGDTITCNVEAEDQFGGYDTASASVEVGE